MRARSHHRLFKSGNGGWIAGGERARDLLYDNLFWERIEHLHSLLQAVNTAQIISEGDRSSVGQIINRWDDLSESISDLKLPCHDELIRKLDDRLDKQTTAIHWAARALDPASPQISLEYTSIHGELMRSFFLRHIPGDRQESFNHQLSDFRHFRGAFAASQDIWRYTYDYITFWDIASAQAPDLSRLAMRLHETPANSVPSERSFSAMNFIQNTYRTRLSTVKTNKLTYIFMNTKALRRRPILESHHRERRRRRQEREKIAASRKQQRMLELEVLRAEDRAFDGNEVKLEQLDNDSLDDLYEQAIAALPDDEVMVVPVLASQYTLTQSDFEGSYIDPILLNGSEANTNKRLYSNTFDSQLESQL